MEVAIACYPPLGQATEVAKPEVNFICILRSDGAKSGDKWEVLLRYAKLASASDQDVKLQQSSRLISSADKPRNANRVEVSFETSIKIDGPIRFTISYRRDPSEAWVLYSPHADLDSVVLVGGGHTPAKDQHDIREYIPDINPELQSRPLDDGSKSKVKSWLIEASVDGAQGEWPHMTQVMFGKPFGGNFLRWFGIVRNTTSWMAPRQGRNYFKLDVAGMLCSFLDPHGTHLIALGISGFQNVMTIFGDDNEGSMMIKIRNDHQSKGHGRVIVAVGDNFDETLSSALRHAQDMFASVLEPSTSLSAKKEAPGLTWADDWANGLIYCPPTGSPQLRSQAEILADLERLSVKGIQVSAIVLDDSWQTIDPDCSSRHEAGLIGFEADPTKFTSGLQEAVASLKKHGTINNVIVRHPIFGHWGGISNSAGGLRQEYEMVHIERSEKIQGDSPSKLTISVVSSRDTARFYRDYYSFLSSCGINTIQCEGLYMLESFASALDRSELLVAYLDAQAAAAASVFGVSGLTSMSLSPSALLNGLKWSQHGKTFVKNSAAFSDHRKHVFVNAGNAILSSAIGNVPDWGVIESSKDNGEFHAAARVVSGGPVQIASFDAPDNADDQMIQKISGRTATGKIVMLRPTGAGRASSPYVGFEDGALLKIANTHDTKSSTVSILGLFNVSDHEILELVTLGDFAAMDPSKTYLVASTSGVVSDPLTLESSAAISTTLQTSEYAILCAHPLEPVQRSASKDRAFFACLGLRGKLLGSAAIIDSSYSSDDNGTVHLNLGLKIVGVVEIYLSDLPDRDINNATCTIKVQGESIVAIDSIVAITDRIMAFDLARLWENEAFSSTTDELRVELTIGGC